MGGRFSEYLRFKGFSQKKVSDLSSVSEATVSRFCSGGIISSDNLVRLLKVCPDLSPDWLLLGVGSMIRSGQGETKVNSGPFAGDEVVSDKSILVKNARDVMVSHGVDEYYLNLLGEKERIIHDKDVTISERDATICELLHALGKM